MAPTQVGYAPTLDKLIKSLKSQPLEALVENLISLLKRKQVRGSEACATGTAHILLQVVAKSKWRDADQLLDNVSRVGSRLSEAAPRELVIGNIIKRVLRLIRDEATEDRNGDEFGNDSVSDLQSSPVRERDHAPSQRPGPTPIRAPTFSTAGSFYVPKSMFNLLSVADTAESITTGASTPTTQPQSASAHALRSEVIDGIEEIMDEIGQSDDQIAGFAEVQIHPGDYVLVYRPSATVERFLVKAASKRRFTVFLASDAPRKGAAGETPYASLIKKLNGLGVKTISIASSGVVAYMPAATKVVVGASAVLADGTLLADAGTALVARAAKEYAKTVVTLVGVYRLCPEEPYDVDALVELGDSSGYVSFADGPMVNGIDVENVISEFVPPHLIDIYITNLGPNARDHLTNIMADHYKLEDIDFSMR